MPAWTRPTLIGLTLAGFVISGYLAWLSLNQSGHAALGCGEASACDDVLSSKWSSLGPIPVAALASSVYLVLMLLAAAAPNHPRQPTIAGLAAGLLFGAAAWFTAVQAFILETWCPLCMTAHTLGMLTGLTLLASRATATRQPAPPAPRLRLALGLGLGLAMSAALAFTQWLSPTPLEPPGIVLHTTHKPAPATHPQSNSTTAATTHAATEPVSVEVFYDYACPKCRVLHRALHQSQKDEPEAWHGIRLIHTPVSIGRGCGGPLQIDHRRFAESCERTKLVLAVRRLSEEAFSEFDARMMQDPDCPSLDQATRIAKQVLSDHQIPWPVIKDHGSVLASHQSRFNDFMTEHSRRAIPLIRIESACSRQTLISHQPAFILGAAQKSFSDQSSE